MKLYTRTGDDGTTGLFGAGRVSKDHPRVAAYGDVDELNACLGLVISALNNLTSPLSSDAVHARFLRILSDLQSRLFDLGADLATPHGAKHEQKVGRIIHQHVEEAERWIDEVDSGNTALTEFVLPGGSELAARLHLARTVCRRAERAMVHLNRTEPINHHAIILVNRLSDLLFAMARRMNRDLGVRDVPWVKGQLNC